MPYWYITSDRLSQHRVCHLSPQEHNSCLVWKLGDEDIWGLDEGVFCWDEYGLVGEGKTGDGMLFVDIVDDWINGDDVVYVFYRG